MQHIIHPDSSFLAILCAARGACLTTDAILFAAGVLRGGTAWGLLRFSKVMVWCVKQKSHKTQPHLSESSSSFWVIKQSKLAMWDFKLEVGLAPNQHEMPPLISIFLNE